MPATSRSGAVRRSAREARQIRLCWTTDLLGLKGVSNHSTTPPMLATSWTSGVTPVTSKRRSEMAEKQVLQERAAALLALHQPGNPVVLPTVWDAWSAKLAIDAGFSALTLGSHPVADSIGKSDAEGMTFDELLARVVQITDSVEVPVSVDIESGYGEAPTRLIDGLLDVGAVGFNI